MPTIEQSKQEVKQGLAQPADQVDHEAILASLQDEIDQHNETQNDLRHKHEGRPLRFRFKDGVSKPRKRKHRTDGESGRKHRRQSEKSNVYDAEHENESVHPFPREPVDMANSDFNANEAFRDSLFDALADDEGAAYWESVYSQPIHVYARPSVENEKGELERMNDEQYAAYVQARMWERKHPEVMYERSRRDHAKKVEQEQRAREREEFVRRKQRAAWEKAQAWNERKERNYSSRSDPEGREKYVFAGDTNSAAENKSPAIKYVSAWSSYLSRWAQLKRNILSLSNSESGLSQADRSKLAEYLPWPVLDGDPVDKPYIEKFLRNAPSDSNYTMLRTLRTERVRWHPDKIQQLFAGSVDESLMRKVTAVFQVVDLLYEAERRADQA